MWRLNLTPTAEESIALNGNGFTFDDVTSTSSHVDNPAPLHPPVPPKDGQNGEDGEKGDKGDQGDQGDQGDKGDKGDKGDTGATGATGPKGANGAAGANGANGKNGVNGTTTIIHDRGTIAGASMRTIRVRNIKGMKFVSARATLRGKRLPVHGRTIKVNLRGKTVGEYRVSITAKFKADGKVYKVRTIRSLNIIRK